MAEQISLTDDKKTIFLGACQIFSAYVGKSGAGEEGGNLAKSVADAIRIARIIDEEICSEGEVCDRKSW